MTRADELWLAMTFWLVRIVHWSRNSNSYHTPLHFCHNLSCQDTDVFSTTCWGQGGIRQTQLGTNSDLGLSLDTDTCIVHKQANKDCTLRATINSDRSATSSMWHKQGENNQDAATRQQPEGTTSSTWANRQTWLHISICACHPNILPILSRDCHITQ